MRRISENAMGGRSIPLGLVGAFLEGCEEGGELKDRAVPGGRERGRGEGHGGRTGARGHVKGGAVVKERENGGRSNRRGCLLLLQEGKDRSDVGQRGGECRVGHGGTGCGRSKGGTAIGAGRARINGDDGERLRRVEGREKFQGNVGLDNL